VINVIHLLTAVHYRFDDLMHTTATKEY